MTVAPDPLSPVSTSELATIAKPRRVRLWLIAWGVALLVTPLPLCILSPAAFPLFVLYIWAFPAGVISLAVPEPGDVPAAVGIGALIGGWAVYIALTIVALRQRGRARYFVLYTILCVLLILNVVGCNVNMFKGKWHM